MTSDATKPHHAAGRTRPLTAHTTRAEHAVVVHVAGEFDMNSVHVVSTEIDRLLAGEPRAIIIDLREVAFLDSSALRVLVQTRSTALDRGVPVHLVASHSVVLRPLQITGLADVFPVHSTVASAIAACRPLA